MTKLEFAYNPIPNGFKSSSGKKLRLKIQNDVDKKEGGSHDCLTIYSCPQSLVLNHLREKNYIDYSGALSNSITDEINNSDLFVSGGAVAKKRSGTSSGKGLVKQSSGSNKTTTVSRPQTTLSSLEIKKLGDKFLDIILESNPLIFRGNVLNDEKLVQSSFQILKELKIDLTQYEHELMLRYIRDNLVSVRRYKIESSHPLFNAISSKSFGENSILLSWKSPNPMFNFDNKLMLSTTQSATWRGFNDLTKILRNKITDIKNLIHPIFVILFGWKFPGFEDLCILQDYVTMIQSLMNNVVCSDSQMLLVLRSTDNSLLPTINPNHLNPINNEILRMNISMLLRDLAFDIRSGKFESTSSNLLMTLLSDIKMPTAKFPEENLIQSILSVFSFKPTLISEVQTSNNIFSNAPVNDFRPRTMVPKAVYTIEYPLIDMFPYMQDKTPVFSELNLSSMGYDPISNKVVFCYNPTENQYSHLSREEILGNLYQQAMTQKIESNYNDVLSTLVNRSGHVDALYKNITPVNILLTNGMFVLSIPREQNKLYACSTKNSFYRSLIEPTLNLSSVIFEPTITINRINYNIVGALCYDVLSVNTDDNRHTLNFIESKFKIGTYALIKSEDGTWIEYNPQNYLLRKNERLENELKKMFAAQENYPQPPSNNDPNYRAWLNSITGRTVISQLSEDKLCIQDMIISSNEAFSKMSTHACLVFYSEDYSNYLLRTSSYTGLNF